MSAMDSEKIGTIIILIGLFVYGIHPVVIEFGGMYLMPLFFAGIAATLAGLVAIPAAIINKSSEPQEIKRSDYLRLILAGIFATFLAYTGLFIGLQITSSNNAAIILRSELAFALIFSYFFLHETISVRQTLWISIMIGGVLLVILTTQLLFLNLGDLFVLITPIAWAGGHTLAKPALNRVSPWLAVAFRNLVGGSLLLGFSLILILQGNMPILIPDMILIGQILIIETILILLAHGLWYAGIQRINLGKATALIAPAPLVTFFLSIFILRSLPTPWQVVGAAFVITATILLSRETSLKRDTLHSMS
jgi:drug/metabolite transporter (DMT)-like permease